MYNWLQQVVFKVLRVPAEPQPPLGAPGSVRIFRAGLNYYRLRLAGWAIAQVAAFAAIVFWAFIFIEVEGRVLEQKNSRGPLAPLTPESFAHNVANAFVPQSAPAQAADHSQPQVATPVTPSTTESIKPAPPAKKTKFKIRPPKNITQSFEGFKRALVELGLRLPDWAFPLIWALKILGFLAYLAQIPVTYVMRRLDYELRWYIVTDRSLRIRAGLMRLQESTMSFANLQQVEVKQNPIQRLLGLADVHVQSAGGGGDQQSGHEHHGDSLHKGVFHSVDNASEIRDLILERLRLFRQAGLGDPDDHHDCLVIGGGVPPPRDLSAGTSDTLVAAREVLAEARALRQAL